jgi:addiction module RelE/StbE family toxin
MKIIFSKKFSRSLKGLPSSIKDIFKEQIDLFVDEPNHSSLADHSLNENLDGFRAFSLTEDIRVIYFLHSSDTIELDDVGPHSKVYKR